MKAAVPAWARESGSRRLEAGWGLPPLAAALCPGGSYPPIGEPRWTIQRGVLTAAPANHPPLDGHPLLLWPRGGLPAAPANPPLDGRPNMVRLDSSWTLGGSPAARGRPRT